MAPLEVQASDYIYYHHHVLERDITWFRLAQEGSQLRLQENFLNHPTKRNA